MHTMSVDGTGERDAYAEAIRAAGHTPPQRR